MLKDNRCEWCITMSHTLDSQENYVEELTEDNKVLEYQLRELAEEMLRKLERINDLRAEVRYLRDEKRKSNVSI